MSILNTDAVNNGRDLKYLLNPTVGPDGRRATLKIATIKVKKLKKFVQFKLMRKHPYIGIYSFPKSGNTWMRFILSSLYFNDKNPVECIPDMYNSQFIADALPTKIGNQITVKFFKSHNGCIVSKDFGQEINHLGIIYIKRHPLDVFLSHLHHLIRERDGNKTPFASRLILPAKSVEDTIANDTMEYFLGIFILFGTLHHPAKHRSCGVNNWFQHMEYWTQKDSVQQGERTVPIACLKYEDMVSNGVEAMQPLRDMLELSKRQLSEALLVANKKTKVDGKFFWKQKPGLYKDMLPDDLIAKFNKHHGDTLAALGY